MTGKAKNKKQQPGSNDPQLKALRTLLDTLTSPQDREEVEAAIALRLEQLKRPKFMF